MQGYTEQRSMTALALQIGAKFHSLMSHHLRLKLHHYVLVFREKLLTVLIYNIRDRYINLAM